MVVRLARLARQWIKRTRNELFESAQVLDVDMWWLVWLVWLGSG